eukprot:CAMPEP_0198367460 /NCGR_PEP_ID=MMETSP1450-20131203/155201_1 /TAXON_ID=753684 ORGANISM="Madagascaria erythrocladiodes, Strain CCMP3234" /NCGR_SAMPLE_ID=MMETSP1450 /ASSEMBLY_ACC=CAM_ASM_001115 /LENGTH=418 /DNA_ID=CAMNT_0044074943 /DNA_START=70 /DNA_END=1326 /DNA_ORIENTATION=-
MAARAASRVASAASRFTAVPKGPEDAILGVTLAYKNDPAPVKLNLGVGAYRDDAGKPFVLKSVRAAEKELLEMDRDMEYQPVAGNKEFSANAVKLALTDKDPYVQAGQYAAVQTLSGTGACRMAGEFLRRFHSTNLVLMPDPTWANHIPIFKDAGCEVGKLRYYDKGTCGLDFDGFLADLNDAPENAVVLLHACAHNPTGVDPLPEQWDEISRVMAKRNLQPLFDMAYQGFTSGNVDTDAYAVRKFVEDGHRIILAQSFSKNFGLYGHRVGNLSFLTDSKDEATAIESQLKIIARPMYSNPPIHGVHVVNKVLSSPELESLWRKEMEGMAARIISMRKLLREGLEKRGNPHSWKHVTNQHGMFCFSGLTPEQVDELKEHHHVYLTRNGRISMAGVTTGTVDHLAESIHQVTKDAELAH